MEYHPDRLIERIANKYDLDEASAKLTAAFGYYHHCRNFDLIDSKRNLVHYTSAENATNIIAGKQIWMRNARVMNDFNELAYGVDLVIKIYNLQSETGKAFWSEIDNISTNFFSEISNNFDDWSNDILHNTFITSVSEHLPDEDELGRLSMWRAYAPKDGVALVMNSGPFTRLRTH